MNDTTQLLPATIIAQRLGLNRKTIDRWRARGKLTPVTQIGRHKLYSWADALIVEAQTRANPKSPRHINLNAIRA